MENTGEYLKQEREKQQKTVSDIVSSTRISKTVIEAIEANDYKALPPLQYLKGLLRIYAKELNLDAEEIAASYEKVFQGKRTAEIKVLREIDSTREEKKQYIGFILIILLILFLGAGMYIVQNYYEAGKKTFETVYPEITQEILTEKEVIEEETASESFEAGEEPEAEEETAAESLEVEKEPVVEEEEEEEESEVIEQESVRQTVSVDEKFIISFSAKELTWIRFEVDDKPAFDIMLREGESYRQGAQQKMEVRIGNSAGVAVFFNDKPVELNGEHGKPVDFVFPDDAQID